MLYALEPGLAVSLDLELISRPSLQVDRPPGKLAFRKLYATQFAVTVHLAAHLILVQSDDL
jgi:hypothetical protein